MAAFGLTYLQLVNRVLARLREAQVATVNETTYSTFIGTLLNQVKAEVENAYYWNPLRVTYIITTTQNVSSYNFVGAGADAVILEGWNTTAPRPLTRGTNVQFNEWYFGQTTTPTGSTTHFIPSGLSANNDLRVDVYPMPSTAETLKFNLYQPQADLSADGDVCYCPQTVLLEETIARAMFERGDESAPKPQPGETFILRELLSSAAARDSGHDPQEANWEPE